MFEIIMLFAFMYAATCQLLPERPATTKSSSDKRSRPGKGKSYSLHLPTKKHRTTQKTSAKAKRRSHSYAHVA